MGRGKGNWGWTAQTTGWESSSTRKAKDKGKGKSADPKAFPSYDAASTGSSSAPSGSSMDMQLKNALTEVFAQNKLEVPKPLQQLLQPQIGDVIQTDQKKLNAKRKLVAKLDRLQKALIKKEEQWQQFKVQLREHLQKEQTRYDTEVKEINAAVEETQTQLDKMLHGQEAGEEHAEMEQEEDPIEAMLAEQLDKKDRENKTVTAAQLDTAEELRQAKMEQHQLALQLHDLQQQFLYVTAALKPPMLGSPSGLDRANQALYTPIKTKPNANGNGPYAKQEPKVPSNTTPQTGEEKKDAMNIEVLSD